MLVYGRLAVAEDPLQFLERSSRRRQPRGDVVGLEVHDHPVVARGGDLSRRDASFQLAQQATMFSSKRLCFQRTHAPRQLRSSSAIDARGWWIRLVSRCRRRRRGILKSLRTIFAGADGHIPILVRLPCPGTSSCRMWKLIRPTRPSDVGPIFEQLKASDSLCNQLPQLP